MISKNYKSLGLLIALSVAASIEEYDTLAGKEGAALESAVNNEIYRGTLAEFRSTFCDRVATTYGKPRKVKPSGKTKKGENGEEVETEVYAETEGVFIDRVLAELAAERGHPEVDRVVEFKPVLDKLLAETETLEDGTVVPLIRFDPKRAERKEQGPKKLPEIYKRAALAVQQGGNLDKFIAKYGVVVPEIPTPGVDATEEQQLAYLAAVDAAKLEAAAYKMKFLEDAEEAQRKAEMANKYSV